MLILCGAMISLALRNREAGRNAHVGRYLSPAYPPDL
jgi:hypothetical protein